MKMKRFNKKAISPVVATILMVLITIAAVMIIWGAIIPLISDNTSSIGGGIPELYIVTSGGYTTYNSEEGIASVQIQREGGEDVNLEKVQVLFEIQGETSTYEVPAPSSNGIGTYYFSLLGEPSKVSIAPIVLKGNKEEALSIVSEAELKPGIMTKSELIEKGITIYNPVGFITYSLQYQENPNQTSVSGSWSSEPYLLDGKWDTSSYSLSGAYLYVNYTKPSNTVNAIWRIKPYSEGNHSVTTDCFNYYPNVVSFRVYSVASLPPLPVQSNWTCYNGTWKQVYYQSYNPLVSEEGIYWNISSIV